MKYHTSILLLSIFAIIIISGCTSDNTGNSYFQCSDGTMVNSSEYCDLDSVSDTPDKNDLASFHCVDAGGTIEKKVTLKGETDFCILPDGTECEKWDYYNGYCPDEKESQNDKSDTTETWIKEPTILFADTTSSSSIVLDDGTLRLYRSDIGEGIYYSESKDGKTFLDPVKTSITGDVFNPAIVYVENKYIMFYNKMSGNDNEGSGIDLLWRAESTDGKTFYGEEQITDRLVDPKAVVSVPDVIILSDGSLRIYGTQAHDGINTARSTDLGKTWVTDGNNLVAGGAADPDVFIEGDKFYMYYTDTIIPDEYIDLSKDEIRELGAETNVINKAVSADGINWEKDKINVITPYPEIPKRGVAMDADYIKMKDGTEIIFFGKGVLNDKGLEYTHIFRAVKE